MNLTDSDVPAPPFIAKGKYRHYKGKEYEVIGVALHTETLEPLVVYVPLYEANVPLWSRPYDMFVDDVVVNGETKPRFVKIDE